MPDDGDTAMNIGISATKPIGTKSFGTWSGTFGAAGVQRHEARQHRLVERVAVGRGVGRRSRRDAAAGARLVHHDDLLAPHPAERLGDKAERHVRARSRRGIGDDLHRLVGILGGRAPFAASGISSATPIAAVHVALPYRLTRATPIATSTAARPFCTHSRSDRLSRLMEGAASDKTTPIRNTNRLVVEPSAWTMASGAKISA